MNIQTYIQYGSVSLDILLRYGVVNSLILGIRFLLTRGQFMARLIKPLTLPPNYYLFMTKRCNLACNFCHYHGELDPAGSIEEDWEWSLDDFKKWEDQKLLKKYSKVCLYGGEPMLNRDFFKCVRYLNENDYLSSTITNASVVTKNLQKLEENPLHQMTISYYKGVADRHVEALKAISHKTILNISYIMTNENYHLVEEVILFALNIGARFITIENLVEKESCRESAVAISEDYTQFKADMVKKYSSQIIMRWSEVNDSSVLKGSRINCSEPWDMILLDKRGRVLPCCQYPLESFETRKQSSNPLWVKGLVEIRGLMKENKVPAKCEGCHYLYAKDPLYNLKG